MTISEEETGVWAEAGLREAEEAIPVPTHGPFLFRLDCQVGGGLDISSMQK